MANTVDENLKLFLQADSSLTREVGSRIHENYAPEAGAAPYIWFRMSGTDYERTLGGAPTNFPFRYRFDLEIWARSIGHARTIATLVVLGRHVKGDRSEVNLYKLIDNRPDDYQAWSFNRYQPAEPENYPSFIFPKDLDCTGNKIHY